MAAGSEAHLSPGDIVETELPQPPQASQAAVGYLEQGGKNSLLREARLGAAALRLYAANLPKHAREQIKRLRTEAALGYTALTSRVNRSIQSTPSRLREARERISDASGASLMYVIIGAYGLALALESGFRISGQAAKRVATRLGDRLEAMVAPHAYGPYEIPYSLPPESPRLELLTQRRTPARVQHFDAPAHVEVLLAAQPSHNPHAAAQMCATDIAQANTDMQIGRSYPQDAANAELWRLLLSGVPAVNPNLYDIGQQPHQTARLEYCEEVHNFSAPANELPNYVEHWLAARPGSSYTGLPRD